MFNNLFKKQKITQSFRTYYQNIGKPVWTDKNYIHLSEESYVKNVIANRCISIITKSASSVPIKVRNKKTKQIIEEHEILNLINKPNPSSNKNIFFETIYSHKLISGNVYIRMIKNNQNIPQELYILRPDRITILAGNTDIPLAYKYKFNSIETVFKVNQLTGESDILHIKNFNPINDWYGLSQVEPASYSIDQHNEASKWNQAILQNGAKPSGALIVKNDSFLTNDQFTRLKEQLNNEFSGSENAGKPMLLEGGLDWKEISLSPKEMDFLEMKHSTARDIALSFGVPSQLIGIPGDNTYSNMSEARLFLWEQTILPNIDIILSSLNNWLTPLFDKNIELFYDKNDIIPLSVRKENFWNIVNNSNFLTNEEKKKILNIM